MVIEPKQTTVAYRCPHCGAGVMSLVGLFALSADMLKLKCSCGKSEMTVVYTRDKKVRLTVPCILCPKPHQFTVNQSLFFGQDLFVLPCPYSDINICFMGETNTVKAELARTELELLDLLEKNGIDSFEALHADEESDLTDPQVRDIVMFVIHDLDAEGKIYCRCRPEGSQPSEENSSAEPDGTPEEGHGYDAEITPDGIRVSCPTCGASRLIPTDSLLSAHAFLNCDSLHLE